MKEDSEQKPSLSDVAKVNPSDPDIKTTYANNASIEVGVSDVGLIFAYDYYQDGVKIVKPNIRVILSHDSFMRMMQFWEPRYNFLKRVYANRMPNLYSSDPKEYRAALEELFSTRQQDDEAIKDESESNPNA